MSKTDHETLAEAIIARGCPQLQRLRELRATGWKDPKLDCDFAVQRTVADNADTELSFYWFNRMKAIMQEIDLWTHCVSLRPLDFLDLGCCPGGFSSYILATNRNARGVGVSLPVEDGGHEYTLEHAHRPRFDIYFADVTSYQLGPTNVHHQRLYYLPSQISSTLFGLVILDGHQLRTQISKYKVPWDIDRLLVSQMIIALQVVRPGGNVVIKLTHPERITTAKILYMFDILSERLFTHKPRTMHQNRGSFYAIARGVGKGVRAAWQPRMLQALQELWLEITFGGIEGKGRFVEGADFDFAITTEDLHQKYLDRLISLGLGVWSVQARSLESWFRKKRIL
ncbi:hypothetical protein GLOTRDRAFT_130988 [Gloeophyllum trabeum ATCC 11539]|uniref:Ribosomal RNA methyltransferase FtsJ domain-containing protein n=1 Tax=Gloeophyllum trabeum (strain ATCC 11539 / FP-39264 / Madison 617) TaxID=670483 RepID=S7Q128_GLOTA|nr:uncharacterized protein GLOTRDRAFT_130988 [Gloeophyllum trabeum ATCC 11539]EPQ53651.1 hypothetical protein GLOTRDRAFT_130988 [Gloeophyllum trabeum ATCC 11539]